MSKLSQRAKDSLAALKEKRRVAEAADATYDGNNDSSSQPRVGLLPAQRRAAARRAALEAEVERRAEPTAAEPALPSTTQQPLAHQAVAIDSGNGSNNTDEASDTWTRGEAAALVVQATWRGHATRRRLRPALRALQRLRNARLGMLANLHLKTKATRAAIVLQAAYRGAAARGVWARLHQRRALRERAAATCLQHSVKRWLALRRLRRRAPRSLAARRVAKVLRVWADMAHQRRVDGAQQRVAVGMQRCLRRHLHAAQRQGGAARIQQAWRVHKARHWRAQRTACCNMAVTAVQAMWRGVCCRRVAAAAAAAAAAAGVCQRAWRRHQHWKQIIAKVRAEHAALVARWHAMRHKAAGCITRAMRRAIAKRKAAQHLEHSRRRLAAVITRCWRRWKLARAAAVAATTTQAKKPSPPPTASVPATVVQETVQQKPAESSQPATLSAPELQSLYAILTAPERVLRDRSLYDRWRRRHKVRHAAATRIQAVARSAAARREAAARRGRLERHRAWLRAHGAAAGMRRGAKSAAGSEGAATPPPDDDENHHQHQPHQRQPDSPVLSPMHTDSSSRQARHSARAGLEAIAVLEGRVQGRHGHRFGHVPVRRRASRRASSSTSGSTTTTTTSEALAVDRSSSRSGRRQSQGTHAPGGVRALSPVRLQQARSAPASPQVRRRPGTPLSPLERMEMRGVPGIAAWVAETPEVKPPLPRRRVHGKKRPPPRRPLSVCTVYGGSCCFCFCLFMGVPWFSLVECSLFGLLNGCRTAHQSGEQEWRCCFER